MHTKVRTAAPLLIVALLLSGGHTLPATAGALTETYTDRAHGLAFRYPATWMAMPHAKNTGYALKLAKISSLFSAPDGSAAMVAMVGDKKLAGAALQPAGLMLYKDGETVTGLIAVGHATIGNISFYRWSGKVKGRTGFTFLETIYAGTGGAWTYYFGVAIIGAIQHPAASAKILRGIIDSVTIR